MRMRIAMRRAYVSRRSDRVWSRHNGQADRRHWSGPRRRTQRSHQGRTGVHSLGQAAGRVGRRASGDGGARRYLAAGGQAVPGGD